MRAPTDPWLPDLCRPGRLAIILLAAEAVVVVIALAPGAFPHGSLADFGAASALALWIALIGAVGLCLLRGPINRLPLPLGALAACALPVAVAAVCIAVLYEVDRGIGFQLGLPAEQRTRTLLGTAGLAALATAALLRYFYVREQWRAKVRAHAEAEVRALQARIRPHFLFNSMNTIASLVRVDPATAERAVEDLAELFRAALGAGKGEATLAEELHLAERYLAIEGLRLGERLRVEWRLAEPLPRDLLLPRLVLQPLVENAVLHGVSRLEAGGVVRIGADVRERILYLTVENPVPEAEDGPGINGHAQGSIAQRLRHRFGRTARMTVERGRGYYRCGLEIPVA
ncbi:sensor histidine kinase [Coralloluteibacterium thermophilus]|uniref:Sensor histidine kinase n=1 Tax=Coralloluteibacterium thermophilum TaxID=2707049 RepID=A0ABV9NP60_9GAMM